MSAGEQRGMTPAELIQSLQEQLTQSELEGFRVMVGDCCPTWLQEARVKRRDRTVYLEGEPSSA